MTANTHSLWRFSKAQPAVNSTSETLFPLRGKAESSVIRRHLPRSSFIHLPGDHSGEQVACLGGSIWLTQTGNLDDICLSSGETYTIIRKGSLLIQGIADARLEITAQPA